MRSFRAFIPALLVLILALYGCSSSASINSILNQKEISEKSITGMKVELRYLKQSKGSNYKFTDLSGNAALLKSLVDSLNTCKAAKKPEKQFSPELSSDCEIVLTDTKGTEISFLYAAQENMLIYPDRKSGKSGETLQYLYFTPDAKLGSLIQQQQQAAKLEQENAVKPFRNMEELKSSIDPDDLSEQGTDIDFEFFTDATPTNTGTACRIYTSADNASIPQDSYLITAYSKTKTGQQEKLSITAMDANANYTKVTVSEPDDALDSVDTGSDTPESYAITVKKTAIDPAKWIVFVDENNNIFDVILPEDIANISAATALPGASPAPSASAQASAASAGTQATAGQPSPSAAVATDDDTGDTD